jgi:uracil-DNA glycosylase family 4
MTSAASSDHGSKAAQLQALRTQLEQDLPKLPLGNIGEQSVPGDGNPESEIMYIGEAPGYHESVQRKPFVGRSGQLFVQTSSQVGYPREKVYITNIVKVRPPENRDPTPQEIVAYRPYLDKEIEIIEPKLIITLGRFSMNKFLPEAKISQVHGRVHRIKWKGKYLYVLPMYHPAAALRGTTMKEAFVQDFQKIPKILQWIKENGDLPPIEEAVKAALF